MMVNSKLYSLYSSKWEKLCASVALLLNNNHSIKPASPLLLNINGSEQDDDKEIVVMIYGQETNSWNHGFSAEMGSVLNCYDKFFNGNECWSYGGQFWNGVKRFKNLLEEKYPQKKIKLIWNNIVKIGKHGEIGFPGDEIYKLQKESFSVIEDEIKIIKPTVALFLTGPKYDSFINENVKGVFFNRISNNFSERQIARLSIEGVPFAYRTYHPNFLFRNGINNFFNAIIEEIDFNDNANIYLRTVKELEEKIDKFNQQIENLAKEENYEEVVQVREIRNRLIKVIEFKRF